MAAGADPGSPDRGNGSAAASHGRRQHVDHADQEPHGHALDRRADDARGEDLRPRPPDHPAHRSGYRARARAAPGHGERLRRAVVRGRYLDIRADADALARYGLTTGDAQELISLALGGEEITTTVEGRERYPVQVRYARDFRDDPT